MKATFNALASPIYLASRKERFGIRHAQCLSRPVSVGNYSPFGVTLHKRDLSLTSGSGNVPYRYGFNGMEKDDELKGEGNSYDFGARMLDPRLGRFLSIDPYASKFVYQSPYVFAGNMPIWAIDHNGDSVLFYSASGDYLGYSHDNQRYKGKNLLVIIDDKQVKNFNNQYALKRSAEYSSPEAREANVAGLEAMGMTYDVTQISGFIRKYTELLGPDKTHTRQSPPPTFTENNGRFQEQQEWGAWMVLKENPIVKGKMNWVVIDEASIVTDMAAWVLITSAPKNAKTWLHLHTSTSKKSSFSGNDLFTMNTKDKLEFYKKITYAVGQIQYDTKSPGLEQNLNIHLRTEQGNAFIDLDNNSFKDAK